MRQTKPTLVGHLGRVIENNEREMGESKSKLQKRGRRRKTTTSESPIQAEANSQETKYPAKDCSSQFQRTIQDAKMWQMHMPVRSSVQTPTWQTDTKQRISRTVLYM